MFTPPPRKQQIIAWVVVGVLAIFVIAIVANMNGSKDSKDETAKPKVQPESVQTKESPEVEKEKPLVTQTQKTIEEPIPNKETESKTNSFQDSGDFYAVYRPGNNPKLEAFEKALQEGKALEIITNGLNSKLKLPRDVPIILQECRTANAYYDSNKKELVFCYELIVYYYVIFTGLGYDSQDALGKTAEVFSFVVFHELGHALINLYDLPTTGMEEDSADQLATLIMSKQEAGSQALKTTAIWFAFEGVRESMKDRLPFWDEHSLSQQRLYNVLCWTYGSDPEKYSSLVGKNLLPGERAVKCTSEYEKMSKSWRALLSPYSDLKI